jgi:hypothetical protein
VDQFEDKDKCEATKQSTVGYQTLTSLPGGAQNRTINYSQSCPIPNSNLQPSAYNRFAH